MKSDRHLKKAKLTIPVAKYHRIIVIGKAMMSKKNESLSSAPKVFHSEAMPTSNPTREVEKQKYIADKATY
jgi:hypothetical protein